MKWFLRSVLFIIFLIFLFVLSVGYFGLTPLLKDRIETEATRLTGVEVTIDRVIADPFKVRVIVTGLMARNPTNFTGAYIAEMDKVELYPEVKSLFDKTVIINQILIDQPRFNYERNNTKSNVEELKDLLNTIAIDAPTVANKNIIVDQVLITDGQVTGKLTGMLLTVPLRPINQTDIGIKQEGVRIGQASTKIISTVLIGVEEAIEAAGGTIHQPTEEPAAISPEPEPEATIEQSEEITLEPQTIETGQEL